MHCHDFKPAFPEYPLLERSTKLPDSPPAKKLHENAERSDDRVLRPRPYRYADLHRRGGVARLHPHGVLTAYCLSLFAPDVDDALPMFCAARSDSSSLASVTLSHWLEACGFQINRTVVSGSKHQSKFRHAHDRARSVTHRPPHCTWQEMPYRRRPGGSLTAVASRYAVPHPPLPPQQQE